MNAMARYSGFDIRDQLIVTRWIRLWRTRHDARNVSYDTYHLEEKTSYIGNCIMFERVSCHTHYCIVRYSIYRDMIVYRTIFFFGLGFSETLKEEDPK